MRLARVRWRRVGARFPVAVPVALVTLLLAVHRPATRAVDLVSRAEALPLYGAREGRTCDNCHTVPNAWTNPRLRERKCNLSCMTCHVNPTGGGLRTVSGRFFGQSTLPMLYASHRGYKDWNRHLLKFLNREQVRRNRLPDLAWGRPLGKRSKLAFDQDRYTGLRADPLLLLGLDLRLASWFIEEKVNVFPMQLDTHLALHPVEHLTASVTAGVLARSKSFAATFTERVPFMVKDVFLMLHELPFRSYVRVGRFLPPFGTHLDDHTSPIRRDFELDLGILESRVAGVEVGFAPNYPYFHLAVFRPGPKEHVPTSAVDETGMPPFVGVKGWGLAASAGWRDLGWQLGVSGMVRERSSLDGGDTRSLSLQWGFNPWYFSDRVPLTYLGELAFGSHQRELSDSHAAQLALYQELDYLPFNGLNLRVKYDLSDPDLRVAGDQVHRVSWGGDWIALPGLSLTGEVRWRRSGGGGTTKVTSGLDGMLYVRAWY